MTTEASQSNRLGRRLLKMLGGAAIGYLGIAAFFGSGLGKSIASLGPGPLVLASSGLIYLIMALIVGIGVLFPTAGAKVLNVADGEDLAEQRGTLFASTASSVLLGVLQIILAGAGPNGQIHDGMAIGATVVGLFGVTAISLWQWRRYDELMRQVSWESSGMALIVLWLVLGGWATCAIFGAVPPLDPHGVIAALFLSMLAGTFIAVGRRGMLQQD